jgi:phenylpropionate dioxygenase-like ring-hydroxylating dioxygenase large terminal subunit
MEQRYRRPDTTSTQFDVDPTRSFTLPASYYVDPEILTQERETIFWNSWVAIGHASDVREAGQFITANILGQRVFAIRSHDGELRAFFNVCMHRGHTLLEGSGSVSRLITCPYHAWAYNSSGELKGARMSDRMDDFNYDDFQLPEVAIEDFCGFLFVNLSPDPKSMDECYPGARDAILDVHPDPTSLELAEVSTFDISANWKVVGDNLLECYHCHPAHPGFVDLIDMDTYRNETFENWSIQEGTARATNGMYDISTGPLSFSSIFLWPNLSIGRLPGIEGLFLFQFTPTGPEQTLQTITSYGPAGGECADTTQALKYFNEVLGPEDVDLVENVQIGLRSLGYHQGRFICIPDRPEISEHAVHHFHTMVLNALA